MVLPRHPGPLPARLQRYPDLRCVIDRGAKPELATGDIVGWKMDIARIAAETTCLCKLSGLLTDAGDEPTLERIRPAAEHLLASFGADRLMFGSDWPVLDLAGDYRSWVGMAETLLASLSPDDAANVCAGTAGAFHGLGGT